MAVHPSQRDILLKAKNVNLMVALEELSWDCQTQWDSVDVEIFHRTAVKFDSLVALEQKSGITRIIRSHPLSTMNICTKFPENPFKSLLCQLFITCKI